MAATQAAVLLLRPRSAPLRAVPVEARDYFSPAELSRARRFRRGQRALGLASGALDAALLVALVRRPPRGHPAVVAAGLTAGMTVAGLPLAAVSRVRGVRAGLVTQGWGGWFADLGKAQAIGVPLSAGSGWLLAAAMSRFGDRWWLPGAGGLLGAGVLSLVAGPTLIDPLFNRFEPAELELRARVEALARAAGVPVDRVLVMDASKRTTASNAYVTGLGPTKRVVFYDTLLKDFSASEVDFVVAHEFAHVRHRDVLRSLGLVAVAAPATVWSIAEGAAALGDTLPAVLLAGGLVAPAVGAVANGLSRAVERRADRFAMDIVGDPRAQIAFQRGICLRNLAEPAPPRWVQVLYGTHPTTLERIAMAEAAISAS
ncbi:MAG: endopeptidase [Solirubrobacteraceae bacterium]|nr:endopeptidase [Solirubrobacteraceae bacterium]